MPLNKNTLKNDLASAFDAMQGKKYANAKTDFVNSLANAIEKYIKSGTVQVQVVGITTAGSPSAQTQVAPVPAVGDPNAGTGGIT